MGWRHKPRKLFLEKLFSAYQPRKLYCGLRVEFNQIIFHVWQGGRKLTPAKYEYSFSEFCSNKSMLELIQVQLGSEWLDQILALVTGNASSLIEMPEPFLKNLSQYLSIGDLLNLSSTCKYMSKFYSSDDIWKPIFDKFLRSICTFDDYAQVQKIGGYKIVCRKICLENKEKDHTKSLLMSNSIIIGSSHGKMFLSFSTSRFEQSGNDSPKHSQSAPLLECDENCNFLPRTNKSESTIPFDTETFIKSQTYEAHPTNSACSVNQSFDKDEYQCCNMNERSDKKNSSSNCSQDRDDIYFTKTDLMRRLNYLRSKTKRFECDDNFSPGDKTTKYALRYRDA